MALSWLSAVVKAKAEGCWRRTGSGCKADFTAFGRGARFREADAAAAVCSCSRGEHCGYRRRAAGLGLKLLLDAATPA